MHRLNGSDDPKLTETRYVLGIDMLGMLHAPAQCFAIDAHPIPDSLVEIQNFTICPIANRVSVYLEAVLHGERCRSF